MAEEVKGHLKEYHEIARLGPLGFKAAEDGKSADSSVIH